MEDYEDTGLEKRNQFTVMEEDDSDNCYEEVSLYEDIRDARYVCDTSRKPHEQKNTNDKNPNENWNGRKKEKSKTKSNVQERLQERCTKIITSQRNNKSTKWKILFGISLIICTGLFLYVIVKELSDTCTPCTRGHCLNGGQCFISEDDYRCACPRGFYGPQCESTPCSDQPCLNKGACTVWQHTFNCSCLEGFDGTQCEDTPCTRGHCLNGGQCFISENNYRCACPRGLYGPHCENTPCTRGHCLNGGQCFVSEDDYRCACPRGFYGPQCESTPCSDQPCFNNGACTVWQHTFNCSCLEGFGGTQCEDTQCTRGHCRNGGQCFISEDGYRCACPRGFYGPKCESTPCSDQPCFNNRSCTVWQHTFNCSCLEGFAGAQCKVLMPPPVPSVTLCEDTTISGVYKINPDGSDTSITVYCETGVDSGGWTVIQRRVNGSVDFYRSWDEYVSGFGNALGEFWLGLENIHSLTSNGLNELRLDFEDWSGVKKYSKYTAFSVDDLVSDYTLSVSGHTGSATDAMQYHNGLKFSTKDSDNDKSSTNCAIKSSGGWWYKSCHRINLNGLYKRGTTGTKSGDYNVVSLQNWHGDRYSLKRVSMMIR